MQSSLPGPETTRSGDVSARLEISGRLKYLHYAHSTAIAYRTQNR